MTTKESNEAGSVHRPERRARPPLSSFETVLIDAALALTARFEVRDTCRAMLEITQRVFSARSSWILLHDAESNDLVTVESRGVGADAYCRDAAIAVETARSLVLERRARVA